MSAAIRRPVRKLRVEREHQEGPVDGVGVPVSCGGITVRTGDVVLGDCDGVVVVPREREDEVFEAAQHKFEKELHQVEALRAEQEAPDSAEALATLPQLHVSDIGPAPDINLPFEDANAPVLCIAHETDTHRIDYAHCYFDLGCLEFEELPYASILALLLGKLATSKYSASELDTLVERKLGTLNFACEVHHELYTDEARPKFLVAASALAEHVDALATLPREVWATTRFDDRARIAAILEQRRIELEQAMTASGHSWALSRTSSYTSRASLVNEQMSGVDFYLFLRELIAHFDDVNAAREKASHEAGRRYYRSLEKADA